MALVKPTVVVEVGGGHVRGCMNEWAYIKGSFVARKCSPADRYGFLADV